MRGPPTRRGCGTPHGCYRMARNRCYWKRAPSILAVERDIDGVFEQDIVERMNRVTERLEDIATVAKETLGVTDEHMQRKMKTLEKKKAKFQEKRAQRGVTVEGQCPVGSGGKRDGLTKCDGMSLLGEACPKDKHSACSGHMIRIVGWKKQVVVMCFLCLIALLSPFYKAPKGEDRWEVFGKDLRCRHEGGRHRTVELTAGRDLLVRKTGNLEEVS